MRNQLLVLGLLLLNVPWYCGALFAEDAGQLDRLISSAGHAAVRTAQYYQDDESAATVEKELVITSDATATLLHDESSSCYVAARTFATGALVWRRNVCGGATTAGSRSSTGGVAVLPTESAMISLDRNVLRAWSPTTGDLLWETSVVELFKNTNDDSSSSRTFSLVEREGVVSLVQTGSATVFVVAASFDAATGTETTQSADPKSMTQTSTDSVSCAKSNQRFTLSIQKNENNTTLVATVGDDTHQQPVQINPISTPKGTTLLGLHLLSCTQNSAMTVLVATSRGTTTVLRIAKDTSDAVSFRATVVWSAEEGLASLSSGLLVDASHGFQEGSDGTPETVLSVAWRWRLHWESLRRSVADVASAALLGFTNDDDEDAVGEFGFSKRAAFVSDTAHRLYGISIRTGHIEYQHDLPASSNTATINWHRLVHGSPNALHTARGIHGKAHTKEVLVVTSSTSSSSSSSSLTTTMEGEREIISWLCVEAASGSLVGQGTLDISSAVAQIVPLPGSSGCRQGALLVLQDLSTVMVPPPPIGSNDSAALSYVEASNAVTNGFFAHRLDKENAAMESLRLLPQKDAVVAQVSGMARFPGETIVSVAYPNREEVIQSPCNVLGDQSLLLKYLNPHIVVIMTMSSSGNGDSDGKDPFADALKSPVTAEGAATTTKQKRKPAGAGGVTPETTQPLVDEEPNLFVNVIDSVSGRVLYRASHANAVAEPVAPSLLVSENWIVYSYLNARTRRAEVGVLSLYEGMIDNKGLTAFTTPEQSAQFSSLDARESKPVVLSKTYSLAKPVSALGVTSTRGGISAKMLILSGIDGQVFTVDRKMLEPRRPLGQVKDSEKMEGLRQYSELIPMISYLSLSYTQTVEGVKHIVSAPTDLESQSLVMAFGGPDIFFARTSPSRGFDLLPDSFNRVMLSIVVVVLLLGALFLQRIVFSKTVKKGWV